MMVRQALFLFLTIAVLLFIAALVVMFSGFSHNPKATHESIVQMQRFAKPGEVIVSEVLDRKLKEISNADGDENFSIWNDFHSALKVSEVWLFLFSIIYFLILRPGYGVLAFSGVLWTLILLIVSAHKPAIALVISMLCYILIHKFVPEVVAFTSRRRD